MISQIWVDLEIAIGLILNAVGIYNIRNRIKHVEDIQNE